MTPEEKTRKNLIDPALIKAGWDFETQILEEEPYEGVEIINGVQEKIGKSGRVDYLLCISKDGIKLPIAILEAKKEEEFSSLGLDQAKKYADRFHVPFCFSTNGKLVSAYDYNSNKTIFDFPITEFPSPEKLQNLYEEKKGFKLEDKNASSLFQKYSTTTNTPRYYQDASIRAAIEKTLSNDKKYNRILLALATGAGKTTLAVQLIYKLIKSNNAKKVLFLCDRTTLGTQALKDFANAFGADAVLFSKKAKYKNAKIIIATYQSLKLDGDDIDESFFAENFAPGYFSHILIDECHRSAWGKWRYPLTINPEAIHIGLTATPKQIEVNEKDSESEKDLAILADNFEYFGEPVYEYTIGQGQKDGFLAQCEIMTPTLNIDKEVYSKEEILALNPINAKNGELVSEEELQESYEAKHLDKVLIIPKRTQEFAKSFMEYLKNTGGYNQKTIIFCATDVHADYVAAELNNLYGELQEEEKRVKKYAFKFTSKTFLEQGKNKDTQENMKADFEKKTSDFMIATTVDLLSTGVDIKPLKNVVFFRHIASPILFYQMVGRGTRLHPETGKYLFRIYDYTNATRLFGKDFKAKWVSKKEESEEIEKPTGTKRKPMIKVGENDFINTPSGFDEGTKYMLIDEKKIPVQEYMDKLVESILQNVGDIHLLKKIWIDKDKRTHLISSMYGGLGSIKKMIDLLDLENKEQYDFYDILKELVFKTKRITRLSRANMCKQRFEESHELNSEQKEVYELLVNQYIDGGIESFEKKELFEIGGLRERGGVKALQILGKPKEVLQDIKNCILSD